MSAHDQHARIVGVIICLIGLLWCAIQPEIWSNGAR